MVLDHVSECSFVFKKIVMQRTPLSLVLLPTDIDAPRLSSEIHNIEAGCVTCGRTDSELRCEYARNLDQYMLYAWLMLCWIHV